MPAVTVPQALQLALEHHQAGRLTDAETICHQILAVQPRESAVFHLLGIIAIQNGRFPEAVRVLQRSLELDGSNPSINAHFGTALAAQGRLDEAINSYRRSIALNPHLPEPHYYLGNALKTQGNFTEAITEFRRALALRPEYAEAGNNLAVSLAALGRWDDAATAYRDVLRFHPKSAEIRTNLGNSLLQLKQFAAAVEEHRLAIQFQPEYAIAHNNLGIALRACGDLPGAVAACRRAIELRPLYAEASHNLAVALYEQGNFEDSRDAYRRALVIAPDSPQTHTGLGNALAQTGHLEEAVAEHRFALQIRPDYPDAWNNLGNALEDKGQLEDAADAYRRALTIRPDYHEAHYNLGGVLADLGQLDEALATYRRAIRFAPESSRVHSALLLWLHLHPTVEAGIIAEEHRSWNSKLMGSLPTLKPFTNRDFQVSRRLRIGYVSPDFRNHVVGLNLRPLFRCHDHQRFEIFCYSGVLRPDDLTREFRRLAHQWRNTVGVEDDALAEIIRQDGVDILVDLSQHSAGNRLPVFARRPAPLQVSFGGYPEASGLETIQYRLTDRYLEGRDTAQAGSSMFPEQPEMPPEPVSGLYFLDSFWCYDPGEGCPDANELPARQNGFITFGNLNQPCKVNEPVLALWGQVLTRLMNSRLLLLCGSSSCRERIRARLQQAGVDPDRVEFCSPLPRLDYLRQYHRLDIVLDTFPYNGHTTSLDALWMGVPVITLAGQRPLSRAGLSQLSNLGLPELVAHSTEAFVETASNLCADLRHLADLRASLRPRMVSSVLMNAAHFTRQVEAAYRSMWREPICER
jgi:predicted O-linked N-acetylglucosamine transferase (SPINDLY family)